MISNYAFDTESNVNAIREQIARKKDTTKPYIPHSKLATQVITDHDVFPYNRWFRGVAFQEKSVIAEREAGWRLRKDSCYKPKTRKESPEMTELCFQSPCTTTLPCHKYKCVNYPI